MPDSRVAELRADPSVAWLSSDGKVEATAQELPTGVNRIEGDVSTLSGDGSGTVSTPVAVIDTGIDTSHPDLNVLGA